VLQQKSLKKTAYKLVYWQLLIVLGLALIVGLLQEIKNGWSVLLGGFAYILPSMAFVWQVFARSAIRSAQRFVAIFFASEFVKLLTSAILFVLIINTIPTSVFSVLIGYITAIAAFWVASFLSLGRQEVVQ